MDGELELNTLRRFRKHSDELVLEEHGSCEVPAGCGGVVMRWLNLSREHPVLFRFYTPGKGQVYLNGEPLTSASVLLPYGCHTVALALEELPQGQGAFLMAAQPNLAVAGADRTPLWASAADGQWLGSSSPPEDDRWRERHFQASGWEPLQEGGVEETSQNRWKLDALRKAGARPLALPPGGPRLWARRQFELKP